VIIISKKIVNRNLLDEVFFDDVLQDSNVLKNSIRFGGQIFEHYDSLTEEVFYLLYKIVVDVDNKASSHESPVLYNIVNEFYRSTQLEKVRKRTAGDLQLTAICLKYILDEISLKIRGNKLFKKSNNTYGELENLKNSLESLEMEKSNIENILEDLKSNDIKPYSDKIKDSIQKILENAGDINLGSEMETFEKVLKFAKDFVEGSSYEDISADPNFEDKGNLDKSKEETLRKETEEAIKDAKASYDKEGSDKDGDDSLLEEIFDKIADNYESDGNENTPESQEESDQEANDILDSSKEETDETPDIDGLTSGDFESDLDKEIKEAEKEFENYKIKSFELVEGKFKNTGNQFSFDTSFDDDFDKASIEDGTPSEDAQEVDRDISKVDPQVTNEYMRENNNKTFSQENGIEIESLKAYLEHLREKIAQTKGTLLNKEHEIKELVDKLKIDRLLNESIGKVASFKANTKNLSITDKSIKQMKFDDVIKFTRRLNSPETMNFLNKVGKKRETARRTQKHKKKSNDLPTDKIMLSDDLDNMVDDELMNFSIEAFENDFIDRFLHKNILSHERIKKTARHKGPIILCYDGSGSMEGEKIEETKAHIISFIEVAKIQKRKMIIIQFASENEPLYIKEINPSRVHVQDVIDIMDTFLCGGTDFEKPLRKATEYILSDKYKQADILFITDGICSISDEFKSHFRAVKREMDFKLYAIIMHANTYSDYGDLGDISDEVMEIRQMNISKWNEKISEKIFSI
jgi:uncharacterized protein with von Willebrand factor type A (vWA) domain